MTQGQIFRANSSNQPAWSTATYPDIATGTGKILRADGTNWVATTATYPDTAGTSGNVLTSNGTNWSSTALPVFVTTGVLLNSQIKLLHSVPVQLISAPASGSFIKIISASAKLNYGGNNAFVNGGSQPITIVYSASLTNTGTLLAASTIVATATTINTSSSLSPPTGITSLFDNASIQAYNSSATEISGNGANDNTISYSITYQIVII